MITGFAQFSLLVLVQAQFAFAATGHPVDL